MLLGFDRDVARRQWVADVQCPACGNPGEMAIRVEIEWPEVKP